MKIAIFLIGAVLCLGLVEATRTPANFKKHAAALHSLKTRQKRNELQSTKRQEEDKEDEKKDDGKDDDKEDDKEDDEYYWGPRCFGARCDCWDWGLIAAYGGEIGNMLLTCQTAKLWLKLDNDKRDSHEEMAKYLSFYVSTCASLLEFADYYDKAEGNVDLGIIPCCELRWLLVEAYCLNSYMTAAELKLIEYILDVSQINRTESLLVEHLEEHMVGMCDAMFHNEHCLAASFTDDDGQWALCYGDDDDDDGKDDETDPEKAGDADASVSRKSKLSEKDLEKVADTLLKRLVNGNKK